MDSNQIKNCKYAYKRLKHWKIDLENFNKAFKDFEKEDLEYAKKLEKLNSKPEPEKKKSK